MTSQPAMATLYGKDPPLVVFLNREGSPAWGWSRTKSQEGGRPSSMGGGVC